MSPVTCRYCRTAVPHTTETSRNWLCPACGRLDARECLTCGTTAGFPRKTATARVLRKQIETLAPSARTASGAVHQPRAKSIEARSSVYCERHYHEAFFVVPVPGERRQSMCRVCDTTWDRLGPAVHAIQESA